MLHKKKSKLMQLSVLKDSRVNRFGLFYCLTCMDYFFVFAEN